MKNTRLTPLLALALWRLLLLLRQSARHPVKTLVEAVTGRRTRGLDVPLAVAHLLQAELVPTCLEQLAVEQNKTFGNKFASSYP